MNEILKIIFLTLMPFLELRASIPYGVFNTSISIPIIFLVAVVSNIILGPIVYFVIDKVLHLFLKVNLINMLYQKQVIRTQKKIHPYMKKYGLWGLALFIGIPLPGSGVYSGALAAYILDIRKQDFFKATVVGVLIAGTIVLAVSVSGSQTWQFLLKR